MFFGGNKESPGGLWQFGLLPLSGPPRHDSSEAIRRPFDHGVSLKMITANSVLFFNFYSKIHFVIYLLIVLIKLISKTNSTSC